MKKTVMSVVAAVAAVVLVCGLFYYVTLRSRSDAQENDKLTNIQKITTSNLDLNYPATPREVVKLFNKIITCYYNENCTEDELSELAKKAWELFDVQLQQNNPMEAYLASVKEEVEEYNNSSRTITQANVCDSNDVMYRTDGKDKIAFVRASYFVKESKQYTNTYQNYVLRKDADGKWKILVFYQIEKDKSKEDD